MRRRSTLVLVIVSISLLAAASTASATVTKGTAGGEQIELESDGAGDTIALSCVSGMAQSEGVNLLPCNVVTDIFIKGNGGVDSVQLSSINSTDFPSLRRVLIDGGAEADIINATQTADTIESDSSDVINAGAGNDLIEGGAQVVAGDGDDVMEGTSGPADGGPGDDTFITPSSLGPFTGGPGTDTLEFELGALGTIDGLNFVLNDSSLQLSALGMTASIGWSSIDRARLFMPGGSQTIDASGFSGQLEADGRGGGDTITGGSGEDFIFGGSGNDTLTGGGSFDYVNGGPDSDQLRLRDSQVDRGVCGDGADQVVADPVDTLDGCETIDLGADTTPPDTKGLKGPKKVTQGKEAVFKFSSSEPGSTFKCKVDKGKFKPCKSPFKVKTAKLDPTKKHTFSVVAVDAAGNADPTPATAKFSVEAKPSKKKKGG